MEYKVFNKWDTNVDVHPSIAPYVNLEPRIVYHTAGRLKKEYMYKAKMPIIERLINNLMRCGTGKKIGGRVIRDRRGSGNKFKTYKIVEKAFDIIHKKTGKNPVEIFIRALENSCPREEAIKEKVGGRIIFTPVCVSPQRMVDLALRNIARGVVIRSFNTKRKAEEVLAEELILASEDNPQSFAVSKKLEIERIAKAAR
jgi:small subunit ribosomal protein S7